MIKRKRKGEKIHVAAEVEAEETPDLMEALRASLDAHGASRTRRAPARKSSSSRRPTRRSKARR